MKKAAFLKRISAVTAAALVALGLCGGIPAYVGRADDVATEEVADFDNTDIKEDLSEIFNGKDWADIVDLIATAELGKEMHVLSFMEYCYSENPVLAQDYALYLYVYNPERKTLHRNTCVANMATAFGESGEASNFANQELTLVAQALDYKFLKFKLKDPNAVRLAAKSYAATHDGTRRYDIAGFQIYNKKTSTTTSSGIKTGTDKLFGRSYYFSGYAKGMDGSSVEASTLTSRYDSLETLQLDVKQTYWRTNDFKDYVCDEINTAYFSIPNETLEKYGDLQAITAEWYEYKTTPIFVTRDADAYDALKNGETHDGVTWHYWGTDLSGYENYSNEGAEWRILWEADVEAIDYGNGIIKTYHDFLQSYNPYAGGKSSQNQDPDYYQWGAGTVPRLDWIFYKKVSAGASRSKYNVTSEEVYDFMNEYTAQFPEQEKVADGNGGTYAAGLFGDDVDEGRTRGYNFKEIDAGDTGEFLLEKPQSWWDSIWHDKKYETISFDPIVMLSNGTIGTNADDFAESYYINSADADEAFTYCQQAIESNKTPVLFRFANTDYYSSAARFDQIGSGMSSIDGYVSRQTMFLDFDIISLRFKSEGGVETVISVVSDPFNVINDVTPPDDIYIPQKSWWEKLFDWDWDGIEGIFSGILKIVLGILGIVLVISLLGVIVPLLMQGIGWLIGLIPKGIGVLWDWIKSLFKKKE